MKKIFLPLLTVLSLALFTTSCDKEQVEQQPHQSITVTHDANAFEYVGVQHNQGLDYYLTNADFSNPSADIDPLTIRFCETLGYTRADIEKTLYDPATAAVITAAVPGDALRDYFRANNLRQELAYFDQIDNAIRRATTGADAVAQLERVERTVQADKSLNPASQESLLQGIAVGKHSATYWYDHAQQDARSPWSIRAVAGAGPTPQAAKLTINWGEVVAADAAGAVKGGVKGAVKASIHNLVDQVIDQLW